MLIFSFIIKSSHCTSLLLLFFLNPDLPLTNLNIKVCLLLFSIDIFICWIRANKHKTRQRFNSPVGSWCWLRCTLERILQWQCLCYSKKKIFKDFMNETKWINIIELSWRSFSSFILIVIPFLSCTKPDIASFYYYLH